MRLSGILWMWRDKQSGDPGATGLSYRPTPRQWWHRLLLFTPSLGLLLLWPVLPLLPFTLPLSVYQWIEIAGPLAFLISCFALGFWWRCRWVGDRVGHGIMAGLAILAFNIAAILVIPLLFTRLS